MTGFMKHDFTISEIQLACLVRAGCGTMVHKNRSAHGLAVFLGGERTFYFDNKKIRVFGNSIVYFPKGSNYTIKEKEASDCYAINFQMPDDVCFEPFVIRVKNINAFLDSFKSSQKIWEKRKAGYVAKVKSELYNIIFNMQAEYNLPYTVTSVIQPAVEYIHSNYYKESINITELSELCNISSVHLRNTFSKVYGMSPVRYINSLRLARAKELLTSGLYTVGETCFLSGYNDESYFSREFRKHFGLSPKEYAKTTRK